MAQWEEAFGQHQSYVEQHGNARVPTTYVTADGVKLGNWVSTQRRNKPQNILSQDRIDRLEALCGWYWDPVTAQWEEWFEQLRSYVNLNGHARIPATHGFKLGRWVSNQRTNKSKNLLSRDHIERLQAFPGWSWDSFTEKWEEGFEQLRSYMNLNGNASVPPQACHP